MITENTVRAFYPTVTIDGQEFKVFRRSRCIEWPRVEIYFVLRPESGRGKTVYQSNPLFARLTALYDRHAAEHRDNDFSDIVDK